MRLNASSTRPTAVGLFQKIYSYEEDAMKKKIVIAHDGEETVFCGFNRVPRSFFGHKIVFRDDVPLPVAGVRKIYLPSGEGHRSYAVYKIKEEKRYCILVSTAGNIFVITKDGMSSYRCVGVVAF